MGALKDYLIELQDEVFDKIGYNRYVKNPLKNCRNCQHNQDGFCEVIKETLSEMAKIDKVLQEAFFERTLTESVTIIEDLECKCDHYKRNKND